MVEHWSPKTGVGSSSLSFRAKTEKHMDAVINYIKESYNELVYKVSWTKRSELVSHAVVVLVASLLIALVIFAVDKTFEEIMSRVYNLLS